MKIKLLIFSCITLFTVSCGVKTQEIELNNQAVLIEENKTDIGLVLEGDDRIVIEDIKKDVPILETPIKELEKDIILKSETQIIEYNDTVIEGKDIIESYYNNIKNANLEEAYALKKTTQTFEEFKNIYSDTKYLEILSISENIDGNYNTIVEINNILYSAIMKIVDEKIETKEARVHKRQYYDAHTKEIKNKIIYSSKAIDNIIYLPIFKNDKEEEGPLDSRKYLYADGYAAIYSPLPEIGEKYKLDGSYNGFVAGVFSRRYSYFKYYELTSKKLLKLKPDYTDLRGSMLYLFLSNGEKENITFEDINRSKIIVNGYDVFIESFNNSLYQCMSFIERLDDNYVLQYYGCGEKDIYNTNNITFIDKNKIKTIPIKSKELLTTDIDGDYKIINNALMFVDDKGIRYPLTSSQSNKFNENRFNCEDIKDYPLKKCRNYFFESYDEYDKLFFIQNNLFIDESATCNNGTIRKNGDKKTINYHCYTESKGEIIITYDMLGNVIKKKYKDIITVYYINIKNGELEKAYALKKTGQSFEEFKNIYSDIKNLEIISVGENTDGNYSTVVKIEDLLYSSILKIIDGKIEIVETKELNEFYVINGEIVKKNVNQMYSNIHYYKQGIINAYTNESNYYIIDFSIKATNLTQKKLEFTGPGGSYFRLNLTLLELLEGKITDSITQLGIMSVAGKVGNSPQEFSIKSESINVKKLGERNVYVEKFSNGEIKYYFADRLNENQIIFYEGKNSEFISKIKLKEIFEEKEKLRLKYMKNRDCYLSHGNIDCLEG